MQKKKKEKEKGEEGEKEEERRNVPQALANTEIPELWS